MRYCAGSDEPDPAPPEPCQQAERVEYTTVTKFKKTPYTVDVRDLINRPGTMHEIHLDIVVPDDLGAGFSLGY